VKYFFITALIFSFCSCSNTGSNQDTAANDSLTRATKTVTSSRFIYRFADTVLESKITDTLMKLPFIVKSNSYIDSFSNHRHGIAFMSDTTGNQISVAAGYNGPERFETYYNFRIEPKTFAIKILDPSGGGYISIDEYIKKNPE